MPLGSKVWAIAEGYIPGWSNGPEPALTSHETVCVLNASEEEATVELTLYFSDRDPVGPYQFTVGANRTRHVRFNDLADPEPVPRETEFASVLRSSVEVVVQHSRLDSRQHENALMTTIAYPSS